MTAVVAIDHKDKPKPDPNAELIAKLKKYEVAPKPADVDEFALAFHALEKKLIEAKAAVKAAEEPIEPLKLELIDLVRKFGGAHEKKSKLLLGVLWEMMGTFGSTSTIDSNAVERLRLDLEKKKQSDLFSALFVPDNRWTFQAETAMTLLKTKAKERKHKLTPGIMGKILLCFDSRESTPVLKVREKKG